jgi:FixJ family two-component response regulator
MISNLINNAVESLSTEPGIITLKMSATEDWCDVIVADNGKGMSSSLIEKIMNNMAVTEGKLDGNGIGLAQVRETLTRNKGTLSIRSKRGNGTEMHLKFPRIKAPSWLAEEIQVQGRDVIVILDDDHSIHGAWDSRFEPFLEQSSKVKVHHFELGKDALAFLNSFPPHEKKKIILLTDYELLKQELNGLDVVEKANISRSILVTSHYDRPDIQERACCLGAKILPKQLASEIPINIRDLQDQKAFQEDISHGSSLKTVDAIWVDDDEDLTKNLELFLFDDKNVIFFNDPEQFLKEVTSYEKNTRIYLDNNYKSPFRMKGVDIAAQLHDQGYTDLTLVSGEMFTPGALPDYLKVILKSRIDQVMEDW